MIEILIDVECGRPCQCVDVIGIFFIFYQRFIFFENERTSVRSFSKNMKRFLFFENERTDVRTVFKIMQDDVGMWDGKHRTQNPL